ncbi:hypothetical protein Bpla01_66500 [Burkholderia plantarii]|nr:hypothetical protein Bpla01_66500 [Burkholderia plantarii]
MQGYAAHPPRQDAPLWPGRRALKTRRGGSQWQIHNPKRKDETVSATTPDRTNHTNVPGVPPGPPEAHRQAGDMKSPLTGDHAMSNETEEFMIDGYAIVANLLEQATTRHFKDAVTAAYVAANPHPDDIVVLRQLVERSIVACAAAGLIGAGYALRLHDGEKWATPVTTDLGEIMAALMASGEEELYAGEVGTAGWKGCIRLIYDDLGWDVLGSYSPALIADLSGALALSEALREPMSRYFWNP